MTINAKFKTYLDGVLTEVFFRTGTDNVIYMDGETEKTLTAKLAEIIAGIAAVPSTSDVQSTVTAAIAELIDSAPESLNTLKELADAITENDEAMELLNTAIGAKVDKVDGKGLSTNDLTNDLLASINAAIAAKHTHENADILDAIESTDVANWNAAEVNVLEAVKINGTAQTITDKAVDLAVPVITVGSTAPTGIKAGDLFLEIIE